MRPPGDGPARRGPARRIWTQLRRSNADQDVAWEIEHHLAEMTDRLMHEGWTEDDARAEAVRRFGEQQRYRTRMRRIEQRRRTVERMTGGWAVLRGGARGFLRTARRHPGFALGVVITLALGIGANATIYGVADRLLLQPPAHIAEPDRVVPFLVHQTSTIQGRAFYQSSQTFPDFLAFQESPVFSGVAGYTSPREETVGAGADASRAQVSMATHDFFPVLGVDAVFGRLYTEEEDRQDAAPVALISEEYWSRAFGRDPDVLGRTLDLSGFDHTIVGVLPRGFTGVELEATDIWVPLETTHSERAAGPGCLNRANCWWLKAVARLADGVTREAAAGEATRILVNRRQEQIEAGTYPEDATVVLSSVIAAQGPNASAETRVAKWLTAVSLIVLLIACANVANLFLARTTRQRREIAVRLALGVSRARLLLTTMAESVLIALVGGALALVIARWGGAWVRSTLLPGVYFPDSAMNGRVLAFTGLVSILAGLAAGVGPALQGTRADVTGSLVDGGRGGSGVRSRLRAGLTVLQATLSVVLLVGAGLFVRSLSELRGLDIGFDPDHVLMASLEFKQPNTSGSIITASGSEEEQRWVMDVYREAAAQLTALPFVAGAAGTTSPFGWSFETGVRVDGLDSLPRLTGGGPYFAAVGPDYFRTVGLEMRIGRAFDEGDVEGAEPVAAVSETMARTLWPERSPIGECIYVDDSEDCTSVVAVVQDAMRNGFEEDPFMAFYLPLAQHGDAPRALYVRVTGDPEVAAAEISRTLRTFSPDIRFANVQSVAELIDPQTRSWKLGAAMFTLFGLLALVLAGVGLYSVLAFDIAQRTRELGIRAALGAEKGRLLRDVLRQGTRLAFAGVVLGLIVAYVAAPFAQDLLFQVSPHDPWTLGTVGAVLVLVGILASVVPGIRATRLDPVEALRAD